jgi:hypothetical protein
LLKDCNEHPRKAPRYRKICKEFMGIVPCVQVFTIFSFLGSLPVLIADIEPVGYKGQRRTRRWMINVSNKLGN